MLVSDYNLYYPQAFSGVKAMNVLIVGGTRYFGIPMTERLLRDGHTVTVATRGRNANPFADRAEHIIMDKTDAESVRSALSSRHFDVIIDKVAYSSNDVLSLLQIAHCDRYIQMSSTAVYNEPTLNTAESAFLPEMHTLILMDRPADYGEGKRQAERAALECMPADSCTFVRYPVVLGEHDYTGRLRFYSEHIINEKPMCVRYPDPHVPYIHEKEAGEFLAYLAAHPCAGAVNAASLSSLSQREIISIAEQRTGKIAVFSSDGDPAPFDSNAYDISYDIEKALSLGFSFTDVRSWIVGLIGNDVSQLSRK